MDDSLDSKILDQLTTGEARALHEISDRLSSCGVGKIVNLPQIIVVGEQSAGKSSVLEAISHVRFPVKGDLCTRFATELVIRHAKETRVDVSIEFADKSKPPQAFQRTGFSEHDLPSIIKEAKGCMGISGTGRDFSKDVLRLQVEGPNMYPLTLVDLPGLFHVDTADQSMRGKETVDELVESYMKQKNSIILVVINASNQLANHIALRKVKEHDPLRERTIGVITKPDLTRSGYTDERTYIQLAKNQESANKLRLGWHVLRNRAEDEASLEDRDAAEEHFFQTTDWASIPREDRGVVSLRRKLSRVLYDHVRKNLHGVVQGIEGKLRERQEELDRLGKPRSSQDDMRSFLLSISGEFQRLAHDAIHGRYSDAFFGGLDDQDRKLRAQIRNLNRVFDYVLTKKGAKQAIGGSRECEGVPDYLEAFMEQHRYDFPDPEPITLEHLNSQLQQQAASNRGREFPGSPNKELVIQLFQKQASPWKAIAEFHVNHVTLVAKAFVDQLFRHVIGQPDTCRTTEAILSTCVDSFFSEKEQVLRSKLDELLRPYARGYALPLDADFHRTISQRTVDRLADRFVDALKEEHADKFEDQNRYQLSTHMIRKAITYAKDFDGGEFGSDKVIDMMEAYYEMARRTFTDNVVNLAIESCLVVDIPDILTPTKVDRMTKEQICQLAAESEDAQSRREQLQKDIEVLRQGLELCRRYRPRTVTVFPSTRQNHSPPAAGGDIATKLLPSTVPGPASTFSRTNGTSTPSKNHDTPGPSQTARQSKTTGFEGSPSPSNFGFSSTPVASKPTAPAPTGQNWLFGGPAATAATGSGASRGLFASLAGQPGSSPAGPSDVPKLDSLSGGQVKPSVTLSGTSPFTFGPQGAPSGNAANTPSTLHVPIGQARVSDLSRVTTGKPVNQSSVGYLPPRKIAPCGRLRLHG